MYFSPKTSADGLVFHYDTGNTVRSYLGEPTTNLIDSVNFTTDYNTSWNAQENIIQTKNQVNPLGDIDVTAIKIESNSNSDNYFGVRGIKFASSGTNHTFSFWAKGNKAYNNFPINFGAYQVQVTVNITTEWKYFTVQTGAGTTFTDHTLHFGGWGTWTDNTFDLFLWRPQLELKSHATPYVNGTRSATQGLKDLTVNRTIDLSNVSFDSNAEPEFDGSDDVITFGSSANIVNKSYTIETVFNRYSVNRVDGIIGDLQYHWFSFYVTSNNELYFFHRRNSPYTDNGAISATGLVGTGYYHAVGVFDINSGMRVYLNGNLVASNSNTTAFDLSGRGPQYIGQHRGGAPSSPTVMSGQIPVLKIYEGKALTADEVARNFNAIKSRFNIG